MNFLQTLKLIFLLLPIIHTAVDQIEELFPQGGYGAEKLALVKITLERVMAVSDIGNTSFAAIWPIVSGIVANIVSMKKLIKAAPVTVAG